MRIVVAILVVLIAALSFAGPPVFVVQDTPYDADEWDNNKMAASKNAIRDKIEALAGGHDAVTMSGVPDYIELSPGTQNIVRGTIDIGDDTNLAAGTGITLTGDSLSTNDGEIVHDNLSGVVANEHINWTIDNGATDIHEDNIPALSGYESSTSNDIDPDRIAGDTVDDNLLDEAAVDGDIARLDEVPTDADFVANGIMERTGAGTYTIATEGTDYYGPGGTDIAVADGGTGASNAAGAKSNLGFMTDVSDDATPSLGGNLDVGLNAITGYTASRALETNVGGDIIVSAITSTELGYLDTVSSNIQTQIDGKIGAAGVTYENLNTNGDVGSGAAQVAQGNHNHDGTYESATSNDIDPDRLAGDAVDDNLIAEGIIHGDIARDSELPTVSDAAYSSIDWNADTNAASKNALRDKIETLATSGAAEHDNFSDFVANEHIDWTGDQGATDIHSGNIPDLSDTYQPLDFLLTDIAELTDPNADKCLMWDDAPTGEIVWADCGASQLSDLSDVNTSTPTNRNVLVADGIDFESRALTEADISDLGAYITSSGVTYENLDANGDIGTGAGTVASGNHTHDSTYVPLTRTLTAGTGLTGGGDLSANRTFNVDVGITDNKIVQIDDTDAAVDDFLMLTASGAKGRDHAQVLGLLSGDADATFSWNDQALSNVGDIALDSLSSDAGTSVSVTLGTDAGDDFIVATDKFVVSGDTGAIGIGTANPLRMFDLTSTLTANSIYSTYKADNATGNKLTLEKQRVTSKTLNDGDGIFAVIGYWWNDAATPEAQFYPMFQGNVVDASDGTEDTGYAFWGLNDGVAEQFTFQTGYLNVPTGVQPFGATLQLVGGTTGVGMYDDASDLGVFVEDGGDVGINHSSPDTALDVDGAITARELSADPSNPDEGSWVIWMSDGTGSGDDGDIMVKITAGGSTKTTTLIDFSTL